MKYESPITCHLKDMANVKVFADGQTDRRTGQKLYAPDLSIRGHNDNKH
jgi:ribosome-associated protein YbcJ (S4-like RNA binding protein)